MSGSSSRSANCCMRELDLVVVETHPVQYHAPIYRAVAHRGLKVHVLYGSDCSVIGYQDPGFRRHFAWDQDLLEGYSYSFLGTSTEGADSPAHASTAGLRTFLLDQTPNAVLLTGYSPEFHRKALKAAFNSGARVMLRAEATDTGPLRSPLKSWTRDRWLRAVYRRCDALLYIGQRSRQHFERLGVPAEKLFFSPYGVDTRPFQPSDHDRARLRADTRARLGVDERDLLLLFSGKLIRRKDPGAIVRAVQRLPAERERATVICFLGDGELRSELERAAGSAGIRHVFAGFANQSALSPYYHAADLLIVPSAWETWGLVVNDALHHGLPAVVADQVDAHADLIDAQTGVVYRTGDDQALADAVVKARELVGSAEVRAACREKVARYSIGAAADGVVAAWRAVARS